MTASIHRNGFTLIELLIVVSILVILMSLLMPLIGLARKESRKSATLAVMSKVEAALYQFKTDFRAYPYQKTYPLSGESWTNSLYYRVGTTISATDIALVRADMATAASQYRYDLSINELPPVSQHTFVTNRQNGNLLCNYIGSGDPEGDPIPVGCGYDTAFHQWYFTYESLPSTCAMLNRMASERANLLMLIGDVNATGVVMQEVDGVAPLVHHSRDLSHVPLVASPASAGRPGWANDYLQGELDNRYIRGDDVLDAYRNPLIYICEVLPGVESTVGNIFGQRVDINNPAIYGLAPIGRKTLSTYVTGSTTKIQPDAYLPDPANPMHSDVRYWASPGYELEFELWSAGEDGQFEYWRDDPVNRDNIPCEPYNKFLGAAP